MVSILSHDHILSTYQHISPSELYGIASVTLAKKNLSGCIRGFLSSVSKYLNFLSVRLATPSVKNPYRLGKRYLIAVSKSQKLSSPSLKVRAAVTGSKWPS